MYREGELDFAATCGDRRARPVIDGSRPRRRSVIGLASAGFTRTGSRSSAGARARDYDGPDLLPPSLPRGRPPLRETAHAFAHVTGAGSKKPEPGDSGRAPGRLDWTRGSVRRCSSGWRATRRGSGDASSTRYRLLRRRVGAGDDLLIGQSRRVIGVLVTVRNQPAGLARCRVPVAAVASTTDVQRWSAPCGWRTHRRVPARPSSPTACSATRRWRTGCRAGVQFVVCAATCIC